jgi:hypothetical protein
MHGETVKYFSVLLDTFLGAFAKWKRATFNLIKSVCLSVRPSVRPHATTRHPMDGLSRNLISLFFGFLYLCIFYFVLWPTMHSYFVLWLTMHTYFVLWPTMHSYFVLWLTMHTYFVLWPTMHSYFTNHHTPTCFDFHKVWYLSIFRKSVEKIQVWY